MNLTLRKIKSRSLTLDSPKGQLWAKGETHENPLKKREEALGREWFAITAFPLFAGTFGPIASALNICALVQPWRCVLDPNTGDFSKDIHDPGWLVGINAVSLVFGVAANVSIMFVGSSKDSPMAQHYFELVLTTIVAGGLASILLVALVIAASFGLPDHTPPSHAFAEAYYYAIMSACLYFITSSFVIYTAYMLRRSLRQRSSLFLSRQVSKDHRSLKILTVVFMAYLLIGAAIFSHIEGWRYLDGVFWADVTVLTIGFGDFKPVTHLGRSLLFPYTIFGIFTLVLTVYCITRVVFERGKSMWEIRLRDQERIRRFRQREKAQPHRNGNGKHRNTSSFNIKTHIAVNSFGQPILADTSSPLFDIEKQSLPTSQQETSRESRRRDFETMQQILQNSSVKRIWYSMALWSFFSIFLWLVGALIFWWAERNKGWSYFQSVYFTFISLLAIGYGDVTLNTMSAKAFFVLWSLIVVPTLTMLISTCTEAVGTPFLGGARLWLRRKMFRQQQVPEVEKRLSKSAGLDGAGDGRNLNVHDKNHLIIQAIKSIAKDHIKAQRRGEKPQYSFEDWEYIFYLMGVLDEDSKPKAEKAKEEQRTGNGNGVGVDGVKGKKRRTSLQQWKEGSRADGTGEQMLDWLHGMNPLNVSEVLTKWMLVTLVERLERELADVRGRLGSEGREVRGEIGGA